LSKRKCHWMLPSIENFATVVQFISYSSTIYFHTRCEHNQIVPLRNDIQEKVDVGPLVNEESHWMSIDNYRHLQKESIMSINYANRSTILEIIWWFRGESFILFFAHAHIFFFLSNTASCSFMCKWKIDFFTRLN
jgi:hypothetical protein